MSLTRYRAFIKVVELGSITKTANALGYSQPGVSHMIDSLEEEMGFPLLLRNRDSIIPTEDGKRILHYCYQIVKDEDDLKETAMSVKGLLSGKIRIGALNSMLVHFVPKTVSDFSKAYSNIEIYIREGTFEDIFEGLRKGSMDIGFMSEQVPKGFSFVPLFKETACLIVNKEHPFASYDKIPVRILNGSDFIMPLPKYDDVLNAVLAKETFSPNIKHYVASDAVVSEMVSNNLGVSILSKGQTQRLPENVIAKDFESDFHRTLGLCVKSLKTMTPALREFIRVSKEAASHFSDDNFIR